MLYYFPLESYEERYTKQLSSDDGWFCSRLKEAGVEYRRIAVDSTQKKIKNGCVLDAVGRSQYAMAQVSTFLQYVDDGVVQSGDVLFFEDFWHPGLEAIPYVTDQVDLTLDLFGLIHAQSVDEYDFTYPMRHWMRPFEQGIGRAMKGIFVTNTMLKSLVVEAGIATEDKVHITGLPYNSTQVKALMPNPMPEKQNQVIFCSRFDREKQPHFFLDVVEAMHSYVDVDLKFVITTSSETLRSNDPSAVDRAYTLAKKRNSNLEIKVNLSKREYYYELARSKIQLNTALQDWVSWTLLEAATAGCFPLYPWFRSFPETLSYQDDFMYMPSVQSCVDKISKTLFGPVDWWHPMHVDNRKWIYERFDSSWSRMLVQMGLLNGNKEETPYTHA